LGHTNPTGIAIPGTKSINQVKTNAKSTEFKFTNNEVEQIEKAIKEFKSKFFL
jgi:aryl-alcohol dehydrogenase-like predicted oxidoreductase